MHYCIKAQYMWELMRYSSAAELLSAITLILISLTGFQSSSQRRSVSDRRVNQVVFNLVEKLPGLIPIIIMSSLLSVSSPHCGSCLITRGWRTLPVAKRSPVRSTQKRRGRPWVRCWLALPEKSGKELQIKLWSFWLQIELQMNGSASLVCDYSHWSQLRHHSHLFSMVLYMWLWGGRMVKGQFMKVSWLYQQVELGSFQKQD